MSLGEPGDILYVDNKLLRKKQRKKLNVLRRTTSNVKSSMDNQNTKHDEEKVMVNRQF